MEISDERLDLLEQFAQTEPGKRSGSAPLIEVYQNNILGLIEDIRFLKKERSQI